MAKWCTQSVLVRRSAAGPGSSAAKARSYVRKHGYRAGKLDKTETYYRFRQAPVRRFKKKSMRTLCVSHKLCLIRGLVTEGKTCP
jgi:hypothetical protein